LRAVTQTYALLRTPGSPFGESVARCLEARGARAALLDLDAPLRGEPVTVRARSVVWQGVDLLTAAAVLVECPAFPWPQPGRFADLIREGALDKDRLAAQREARSLIASAIPAAAESGRLVNPPIAAQLTASPAVALDSLQSAGLAVQPWSLCRASDDANERVLLDAVGRDFWHEPTRPAPGEVAIEPDRFESEVLSVFVAGEKPLGGLRYASAAAWAAGEAGEAAAPVGLPSRAVELAVGATVGLRMGFAGVSLILAGEQPRLLWFDAGPDLEMWDRLSDGRISSGLTDYLTTVASGDEGRH
jgi:hypothetical protein